MRKFSVAHTPKPAAKYAIEWPKCPVDLELGCGVGFHPISYCTKNPDRHLIAIDRNRERFEKFKHRITRHPQLDNLTAIRCEAVSWVAHFVPEQSISKLFLYYPNPLPRKARWYRTPFMGFLISRLLEQGEIYIRTNIADYAAESWQTLTHEWGLEGTQRARVSSTREFVSHFEKKYIERGETCWDLRFRKKQS